MYNARINFLGGIMDKLKTTNFSVRMDYDIKKKSEYVYGRLGINLTTAINVFLRQSIRAGGFPFDVRIKDENDDNINLNSDCK